VSQAPLVEGGVDGHSVDVLSLSKLGKHYGGRVLFEDVSLMLTPGARYGLVGANGAGKSTLLKMLTGDEEPSGGAVVVPRGCRLGILRQDRFLDLEQRIIDVAMQGDDEVWAAMQKRDHTADPMELAHIEDVIAGNDGYTLEARAGSVLAGLGIPAAVHANKLGSLSGGFQLRVLLAQTLLARADVLLLDEPTNHLDILSIRWLERHIASTTSTVVVISHDVRFLDNVTTHTLDIDYGTVTSYSFPYTKAMADKELQRAQKEAAIENLQAQIDHKQAFVDRFGAKASKAAAAQGRMKQIEKLSEQLDELPTSSRRTPNFRFSPQRPAGKEIFDVRGLGKAYGDNVVLKNLTVMVRRGEKVAIIGENGVGKSTFLKILAGVLPLDVGSVKVGHEVSVGYFAQDHKEILESDTDTPLTWLDRKTGDKGIAWTRGQLGKALFTGDDVKKPITALSGGEAARLVFAGLAVDQPNTLLLDEPTNHLDIEAIASLIGALQAYEGTLVFVSHDRAFVDAIATRIIEVKRSGVTDFQGGFTEYLRAQHDDHLDGEAIAKKVRAEARAAAGDSSAETSSWEEQKKKKNRLKDLEKKRDQVLKELETNEAKKAVIVAQWGQPGFYETTSAQAQAKLQAEHDALEQTIHTLVERWEQIELELAG
jgi:ATPase subunit of ABC transporter with duplicated ATPase domains